MRADIIEGGPKYARYPPRVLGPAQSHPLAAACGISRAGCSPRDGGGEGSDPDRRSGCRAKWIVRAASATRVFLGAFPSSGRMAPEVLQQRDLRRRSLRDETVDPEQPRRNDSKSGWPLALLRSWTLSIGSTRRQGGRVAHRTSSARSYLERLVQTLAGVPLIGCHRRQILAGWRRGEQPCRWTAGKPA